MNKDNWKNYIFESYEKTLFETDNYNEMYDYINNFTDELIFINIYDSMNFHVIHFAGYNLMIKKEINM